MITMKRIQHNNCFVDNRLKDLKGELVWPVIHSWHTINMMNNLLYNIERSHQAVIAKALLSPDESIEDT